MPQSKKQPTKKNNEDYHISHTTKLTKNKQPNGGILPTNFKKPEPEIAYPPGSNYETYRSSTDTHRVTTERRGFGRGACDDD